MQPEVIVRTRTTATPNADKSAPRPRGGRVDRELFCPRLEELLCGGAAAHGHRSNLGSTIASIERGGSSGGATEPPHEQMLRRIGWREGKHDGYDPTQAPSYRLGQLRDSERRFTALPPRHQATLLARYLGASNVHETLRAHFGELAGVVLERWRARQAKARARGAASATAKPAAELARLQSELRPLEEQAEAARVTLALELKLPELGPPPPRPHVELVLRRPLVEAVMRPYRAALRAWDHPRTRAIREHRDRREVAREALAAALTAAAPLRAAIAQLCSEIATVEGRGSGADDEQALVDLCRGGWKRDEKARAREAAEDDVRAAHRAWHGTARQVAKAWLEDEGQPA